MSKRPNTNDHPLSLTDIPSTQIGTPSPPSSKRLKQNIGNNGDGAEAGSRLVDLFFDGKAVDNQVTSVAIDYTRDEHYYIEDGSIVLGVGNVLFKVHASQLKAHSTVFKDMFDMPFGEGEAQAEGTCDERPVVIPGIEPSQFRNLMKMFYCPPSDKLFVGLHVCEKNADHSWDNFCFCSDIARLSHRFGMAEMERWARNQLKSLVRTGAGEIVREASDDASSPSLLLDILRYFIITSDARMTRNIRNIIQCYCEKITELGLDDRLFALFRTPDLLKDDPSLYGFIFALLLGYEPTKWKKDPFTRKDRMALYSAQVHLTPFPPGLTAGLDAPLFQKPTSLTNFFTKVWNSTNDKQCNDQCRARTFQAWQSEFDDLYYRDITDTRFRLTIQAFSNIPSHRLRFAKQIRTRKCSGNRDCSQALLDILDQDIERVYIQAATYYQEIE